MDAYDTTGVRIDGKICSPRAEPMNPEYWTVNQIKQKLGMQAHKKRSKKQLCKDLLEHYSVNITTLLDENVTASAILGQYADLKTMCRVLSSVGNEIRLTPRLREICDTSFEIDVEILARQATYDEYLWSTRVSYTTEYAVGLKRRIEDVLNKISQDYPIFGPLRITHSFYVNDMTYIVMGRSKGNEHVRNSKFTGYIKHDRYQINIGPTAVESPELM